MKKIQVSFLNGTAAEAMPGMRLSDVCTTIGFPINMVCGGNGICRKCMVEIIADGRAETVLACQYLVERDIQVRRVLYASEKSIKILTSNEEFETKVQPGITYLDLNESDFAPQHCGSFASVLAERYHLRVTSAALSRLSRELDMEREEKAYRFILRGDAVIDVIRSGQARTIYGAAIDIGTTTVVCYLYDLISGEPTGTYSALNRQVKYGSDVITRIQYCTRFPGDQGVNTLRREIQQTINDLLAQAQADGIDTLSIYQVMLCGNSTMQHLFLGFYPKRLGVAPFHSITHGQVTISGNASGLLVNPAAEVVFMPLLGGFVGADMACVLLSLPDDDRPRLVFDLGTNGEIAFGTAKGYTVTSTACGPALEGAGLTYGMVASAGAIQHVYLRENRSILLDIIGESAPVGICGSGSIDTFAVLLRAGVINARGQMLSRRQYEERYGEDDLSRRLITASISGKEIKCFVLAFAEEYGMKENICFTQLDARELQKAKGAVSAGWKILLRICGTEPEKLSEICLAGSFGNYLNTDNARWIGLLPDCPGVPIRSIGNAAGTGVQMCLINQDLRQKCEEIKKHTVHQELNYYPDFNATYLKELQSLPSPAEDPHGEATM